MKLFFKLIKVEFRRIFSNGVLMLVFFGAPVVYGVLFGFVYNKATLKEMSIIVVDEDHSASSSKIIDALNDNESLVVVKVENQAGNIAGEMPSMEYVAVVTIPGGFEAGLFQMRYPELQVDLNMANLVPANFAIRGIQSVLGSINAGIKIESLKKQGLDPFNAAKRFEPFNVHYNRMYNPAGSYMDLMMPGILATIMQQVLFLGLGLVFARDFEDGYSKKLSSISKSVWYHFLLKFLPFLLMTTMVWLFVGSLYNIFNIDMAVFTWPMVLLATLFTFSCMFIGMFFSVVIPNQLRVTELLMVFATPSFLLSGYTWPLASMPVPIQYLSNMIPLTHFLKGFRKLAIYKGTILHLQPELIALTITTLICFSGMMFMLKYRIGRIPDRSDRV